MCGTYGFVAPEVISNTLYDGAKADMWSCGVILYSMLTGSLPFDDDNDAKLFQKIRSAIYEQPLDLPLEAQNLIGSLLIKDPSKRLTAKQVLAHNWNN